MAAITRKQFRDANETILEAQRTATPDLLRKTERYRVGSMKGEAPVAWQGEIVSELTYDSGQRTHVMTEEVQIATRFPADTPGDEFDDLMDALLARYTTNYNIIPDTMLELTGIEPNEVTFASTTGEPMTYRGAVLTTRLRIWELRI